MNLDDSLRDKIMVSGPFEDNAAVAQALKFAIRRGKNWDTLPPESKEALEMIATNIAAILVGDPTNDGHWNSIANYARLRGKALDQKGLEDSVAAVARLRTRASFGLPPIQTDGIDGDGAA